MSILRALFIISVIAAVISGPAGASGYGTAGAQILNLNSSAKILARGNAHAGLADDLNAIVYNPAGLAQLYGTEIQFSRLMYYMDTGISSLTIGEKLGKIGLGFKFKMFGAEDTYRSELGYDEKEFNIRFYQYSFGAGVSVFGRHCMGATVNIVKENYQLGSIKEFGEDKKGSAAGIDLGWHYVAYRGDSFGFVIKNIGSSGITVHEDKSVLPSKYIVGGGHHMGRFMFVWEAFTGNQTDFGWQCGLEADIDGFKARTGLIYIIKPDITLGFGVPFRNWYIDYAFFPHQDLGVAHRISLGVYF